MQLHPENIWASHRVFHLLFVSFRILSESENGPSMASGPHLGDPKQTLTALHGTAERGRPHPRLHEGCVRVTWVTGGVVGSGFGDSVELSGTPRLPRPWHLHVPATPLRLHRCPLVAGRAVEGSGARSAQRTPQLLGPVDRVIQATKARLLPVIQTIPHNS